MSVIKIKYPSEEHCKIQKVINNTLITPLLFNFDKTVSKQEFDKLLCSWYKDPADKSVRIVNVIKKGKNSYQGRINMQNKIGKIVLVLQNKKKNKVQLIEVGEGSVARFMKSASLQTHYDNDEFKTTYQENKSNLLKMFGSKKSKRVFEIGSRIKVNSEIMTSKILDSTAGVDVDMRDLELADSSLDTCLPACHREASSPEDVYRIQDILNADELCSMEDEAFTIMYLMPFSEEESGYSQFFIDALDKLQNKINLERVEALLYAEALIKFINLQNLRKMKKKELINSIISFSPEIAKKIIDHFTIDSPEGRIKNVTMEDKIVIHIVVLIIIVLETCNIQELAKYLPRFNIKKIGQISRALCLSTRDKITWCVRLPLPPPISVHIRRRK